MRKIGVTHVGAVDTPWFDGRTDVDRSKMLQPSDIASVVKLVVEQSKTRFLYFIGIM